MNRIRVALALIVGFATAMTFHYFTVSTFGMGVSVVVMAAAICAYGCCDFVEERQREQNARREAAKAAHPAGKAFEAWLPIVIDGGRR